MAETKSTITSQTPEIESTLARLSAYRNVRGVMVLKRAHHVETAGDTQEGGIVQTTGSIFEREEGLKYAKAVEGIVDSVQKGVLLCEAGDELKLMRIRTKRHELIITPDDKYVLVVLQDPQ
ncbi:uncharacterized protein L203_100821 [Cryptococcus depauperatus CBS 7841]|uniref:Uncharacterized protein n=1 Tax=Cryptococcus depauperatus CBS 7841 TaxID=1295531 RepID=A0A1E3J063_9TREE|nr:dynein light chain roadblock-type [Cryptococcus depauperatus CBS 7841]